MDNDQLKARLCSDGKNIIFRDVTNTDYILVARAASQLLSGSVIFTGSGGTYTQDNSNLFYDAFNKRLGLGLNNPSHPLHVVGWGTGLRYALKVENYNNAGGESTGVIFSVDGDGGGGLDNVRGKGAITYTQSGSWNRGYFSILQNTAADNTNPTLADSVVVILNNGNVGVGQTAATTTSKLHVNGAIATATISKTANYTLTANDSIVLANANSGAFTLTLPDATTCGGRTYIIKKTDASANVITIATNPNTQTIDGTTTITLTAQYQSIRLVNDTANWYII